MVSLLFLLIMMALVKWNKPYTKACMNQLEFVSLFISAVSVYFSVFFITQQLDTSFIQGSLFTT
jgi:hypothetical protein